MEGIVAKIGICLLQNIVNRQLGQTFLTVIPPTRPAIADFSNGCGQELCEVSSKH